MSVIGRSITRFLKDTVTRWAYTGSSKYGDPSLNTPAAIVGRWQSKTELFITAKGQQQQSRAIVYTFTAVAVGDYLYLGTSVAADPETVTNAWQVLAVQSMGDIENTTTFYKVYL